MGRGTALYFATACDSIIIQNKMIFKKPRFSNNFFGSLGEKKKKHKKQKKQHSVVPYRKVRTEDTRVLV